MSEGNSGPEEKYERTLDAALEKAGDRIEEIHDGPDRKMTVRKK